VFKGTSDGQVFLESLFSLFITYLHAFLGKGDAFSSTLRSDAFGSTVDFRLPLM